MEKVYEELDEAKAEIEKLKAELRAKTDSLENLKRSLNAQVNQAQEAKFKSEKLDQELLQKTGEIAEVKSLYEDLKGNLKEQASIIKHLNAANDKLRADFNEKIKMFEDEKRGLLLALEEANDKAENQEQQICQYRKEIENLKSCLSDSKKKCSESQKNLKSSKELSERDDMFQKLEEEKVKFEDQLKWKKEQFKHLEEAYEKLKGQFRSSKKEWEMEKSTLLDDISSLQIKLDSQIRISEDLQYQLQTCHQALAHVESQKKRLEVEVSDFRLQLDNIGSEYQDAKLQLDCDRDKDIADLRYSLKTKEAYIKEAKYQIEKLKQENQEIRMSLKELQEAQIQEAGAYSQSKLRTKLRNLEQTHKECALTLKAREAGWNSRIEQLNGDLNMCQSELGAKTAAVEELQMELVKSYSIAVEMRLLNEEMYVMQLVLKQGISEAQLKLVNHKDEMNLIKKEKEREIFELMKQLEMKDDALSSAQKGLNEKECEKAACLVREVESYGSNKEELQHSLQNELDRYKKMLEESTNCQQILEEKLDRYKKMLDESTNCQQILEEKLDRYKKMLEESTNCQQILEEKLLQMECDSKEQLRETHEALDIAINELDERIGEISEMEFELQIWKSIVNRLKNDLEESHLMRKELEASLLAQVDVSESLKQEKDKDVEELQKEVVLLEQESFRREFESVVIAKSTTERKLKMENENLVENVTKLSLEREKLLAFVQGLCDRISESSIADTQLMDMLRNMEQSFEIVCPGMNLKKGDESFLDVKENMLIQVSPTSRVIKKVEAISDIRSPFKELNSC